MLVHGRAALGVFPVDMCSTVSEARMRRPGQAGYVVFAIAWGLCGAARGAGAPDPGSPKAVIESLKQAARAGDRAGVLACFDAATRKKLEHDGEHILQEFFKLGADAKIEVGEATVEGDKGTLAVILDGEDELFDLVKEGGVWRIRLASAELDEMRTELKKTEESTQKPNYSSPKTAWLTLWAAARAGDRETVLACFSKDSEARLRAMDKLLAERAAERPKGMASIVDQILEKAKSLRVDPGEARIAGERATLRARLGDHPEDIPLVREGGAWKIDLQLPEEATMKAKIEEAIRAGRGGDAARK
jgi:hypothetical protein